MLRRYALALTIAASAPVAGCGMDLSPKTSATTAATGATGSTAPSGAPDDGTPVLDAAAAPVAKTGPSPSPAAAPTGVSVAVSTSVSVSTTTPTTGPDAPDAAPAAAPAKAAIAPTHGAQIFSAEFIDQDNKARMFIYEYFPTGGISFDDTALRVGPSSGFHLASRGEVVQILSQHKITERTHAGVWTSTEGEPGEHLIVELDTGVSVSMGDVLLEHVIYVSNDAQQTSGAIN